VEPSIQQPKTLPLPSERRSRITPGEKFLGILLAAFIAIMAIQIVTAQAAIYEVNKDIQDVQSSIQEQGKQNGDLEIQISELRKPERILSKASDLGLNLEPNNVKVVEKK